MLHSGNGVGVECSQDSWFLLAAMVSYQLSPLELYTFRKLEEWLKWIRRFECFSVTSCLDTKSDKMQINTIIY